METVNKPLVDPIEALLLRLLHGGLDDLDIAIELCGSLGFMETVKSVTCKTLGLESEDELRLFADKWCKLNPLPEQKVLEVVRPHPELGMFAVVQRINGPQDALHRVHLGRSEQKDPRQRELLKQYIQAVIKQHASCNFTGGSTIDGVPAPGWTTLKKNWPRTLPLCMNIEATDDYSVISITYRRRKPEMIRAMYAWLDAQFAMYADLILIGRPETGFIQLESAPKQRHNVTTFV